MNSNEITGLLSQLVSIPSVNRMGDGGVPPSSRGMVAYLKAWLKTRGIGAQVQSVSGGEENLTARIGPAEGPAIILDAHTDTVPAAGWEDRAFIPRIEDGKLFGRGSCDTKGCMTAMLVALAEAAQLGEALPQPVVFVAPADEEFARTGVQAFLDAGCPARVAIVGEPTQLQPVVACKGAVRWDLVVPGRNAHSSRPHEGVNAITRLGELLQAIEEYNRTVASAKTHPLVEPATLTPTLVQGGSAPNVVPSRCVLHVDLRTMPGEDPQAAGREARAFLSQRCSFPLEHRGPLVWHGADLPTGHPLVQRCLRACREACGPSGKIEAMGANYGCHASDYAARGIPAVVLGPGDIGVAHAVDEFVPLAEVETAARIYLDLITRPL